MNQSLRLLLIIFTTLLVLFIFPSRASAAVIYIGDYLVDKVADELADAELQHVNIAPLIIAPNRLAALSNLPDWWPEAMRVINSYQADAVIISLGINDMSLRANKFPANSDLDNAVASILNDISNASTAAVFWVIPPIAAADRSHYIDQRNAVINAVNRAQLSGNYQNFYVIDLDFWASQNEVEVADLLAANKESFTNRGAKACATIVVTTVNSYTAP